jgi:mRNA interferase HigB
VIAKRTLREYWERYPECEQPLKSWHKEASEEHWRSPQDIKNAYPSASFLPGNRVVFNIKGNKYRLIVRINYEFSLVWIRFIGSHAEYSRIDAREI